MRSLPWICVPAIASHWRRGTIPVSLASARHGQYPEPPTPLERFVANRREKVLCSICDRNFTPETVAELLYAGAFPVGFLCPECFSSPRQAAVCARKRASTIRTLAKEARDTVSRPEWLTLLHLAHSRANYWESLAARIENLNNGDWNSASHEPEELCGPRDGVVKPLVVV